MAVGIEAIDSLKLDEAFAHETFRPFNECWTVRMDRELLVVDDDNEKYSRFSDDLEEESKALMVINEKNKTDSASVHRQQIDSQPSRRNHRLRPIRYRPIPLHRV